MMKRSDQIFMEQIVRRVVVDVFYWGNSTNTPWKQDRLNKYRVETWVTNWQ